jgi:hypothetical protein
MEFKWHKKGHLNGKKRAFKWDKNGHLNGIKKGI